VIGFRRKNETIASIHRNSQTKNLINNISIFRGIFYPVNKKPGHFIVKVQLNKGEVMLAQEEW